MAAQLVELKAQVEALTGFKGFAEDLQGINQEMTNMLDTLKKGKDEILSIPSEKLGEVMQTEIANRLKAVEDLSKKIQEAPDTKAMSEIQANIALETNAIELLKQQAELVKEEKARKVARMQDRTLRSLKASMYKNPLPDSGSSTAQQSSDNEDLGRLLEM